MRVSASMESLWQYIQSLSLSERNRVWLADKLLEGTRKEEEETEYISKEEILAGIDAGLKELRLKKEGKLQPTSARDFLKELRNER
ncbi:surface protein [Phocaeicola salanitronis]|uniref:surface protein n=1 Tax=Phocaeicola salanitronis TaxID=376805 RepID=UPI0025A337C8|nr:surface protein [Phocaeicola salanitronis]MDM8307347.1 surface protein [Phocaeicola salanitronis]